MYDSKKMAYEVKKYCLFVSSTRFVTNKVWMLRIFKKFSSFMMCKNVSSRVRSALKKCCENLCNSRFVR